MSWENVELELREVAERVCTARELEALKLVAIGAGDRRIATMLGISRSAARDRLRNARLKIRQEFAARRGIDAYP